MAADVGKEERTYSVVGLTYEEVSLLRTGVTMMGYNPFFRKDIEKLTTLLRKVDDA